MKKYLIKVCFLSGWLGFSLLVLLVLIPYDQDAYLMAYNKKCHLLDSVPSPRILFVGGSNLAFGLDSERISDSLHLPVVNYGLHAGIGLKFMVDDVEQYIRKGDVVVFAPEYSHFYGHAYGESLTLAPLMAYTHWKKCGLLNGRQIVQVLSGMPDIIRANVFSVKNESAYRASGFNEYGDEIMHWNLSGQAILSKPIKGKLDEDFGCYFIERLNRIREKGGKVVLVPPVIRASGFEKVEMQARAVERFLGANGNPFLVPVSHHVLSDSCAYDTDYHMNKKGVDCFTSLLIQELR